MLLAIATLAARAWSQPAPLSGFSDQGAFSLYANEERIGRLTFHWKPDGNFESSVALTVAGQSAGGWLSVIADTEGRWTKATLLSPTDRRIFERDGQDIRMTFSDENGKATVPENLLVFEHYSPALITQALRAYDRAHGGRQKFPLLDLSDDFEEPRSYEVVLEAQGTEQRIVGGRRLQLTRWLYTLTGCELHVLAGPDHRVYLVSGLPWWGVGGVPEQQMAYVREGYEELRQPYDGDPRLSPAKYDVRVEAGLRIPMRDGVSLCTDLYLPVGVSKAPVILVRTPYKKEMGEIQARFFARRGYVFAVQDVRGRFASEGAWEPVVHEPQDGYDAIEWLARQPWSSGKVGMIGTSYLGWVQWLAAARHPPHLTTIVPNVSPTDPFHNFPFDHGLVTLSTLSWVDLVETNATGDLDGVAIKKIEGRNYGELLKPLPLIDVDKSALGRESPSWRRFIAHSAPDSYWRAAMFLDKLKDVRIPVFHQSGWFDGDSNGTKLNYLKMAAYGHAGQKLTLGPWGHTDTARRIAHSQDFGPAASIDLQRDYLRWFDYWLKGMDNGILQDPLVSLFVMGSNRWLYGPAYPLPQTRFENLYLADGARLSFTAPNGPQSQDRFIYDPGNPTPPPDTGAADKKPGAPRTDVLVYTTAPFEKPYTIAGPVSAVLYAASSARDTDWFVHLMDVDQDGKCSLLWATGSGQIRARYRKSMAKAELLEPGRVYKYTLDLWHTAIAIAPGHRLRVEVASAAFPNFSRNLNTGGNNETESRYVSAHQTIYHDAQRPSHIVLPVIPEK